MKITCAPSASTIAPFCRGNKEWRQFGAGNAITSHVPTVTVSGELFSSVTTGNAYTRGVSLARNGWCWGADDAGQSGTSAPISNGNTTKLMPQAMTGEHSWFMLSASNQVTCGVTADGAGYCWGNSTSGRPASAGSATSTPRAISGGHIGRQISAGYAPVCGVTTLLNRYCWGANGNRQLGVDLVNGSMTPALAGNSNAIEIPAANVAPGSAAYTCAISPDRLRTVCWGRNAKGRLGNDTTTSNIARNIVLTTVDEQAPVP